MNRRSFLHSSAATATLASLPFSIRAADKAGTKKFRTVLIGCGWWGNNILREALASPDPEVALRGLAMPIDEGGMLLNLSFGIGVIEAPRGTLTPVRDWDAFA